MGERRTVLALVGGLAAAALGCGNIPVGRYGVERLRIEGAEEVDPRALAACLATHEREVFSIPFFANPDPECGTAPFEDRGAVLRLWHWPWTDWSSYDRAVLDRDLQRITRWYRARGFYDARVVDVSIEPESARARDRIPADPQFCDAAGEDPDCAPFRPYSTFRRAAVPMRITITVEEGQPVTVRSIGVHGIDHLPESARHSVMESIELEVGDRFDESFYDTSKQRIAAVLRERTFACVDVNGQVALDATTRVADVAFTIAPGPPARIGRIRLTGNGDLSARRILAAAELSEGDAYSESEINDAQRAIYAFGAFSSVSIEPQIEDSCSETVDLLIRVVPGRLVRGGVGGGFRLGQPASYYDTSDAQESDLHGTGHLEWRNFLGGLRRFRLEDQPRLIFNDRVPWQADNVIFGNVFQVGFRQLGFIESRLALVAEASHDFGPDPFEEDTPYRRHEIDARIGVERSFFGQRLTIAGGLHGNGFIVHPGDADNPALNTPANTHVLFWEQSIQYDHRDNPVQPRKGFFLRLVAHEAGFGLPASWDYVRLTPEARFYIPLPARMVLAGRFALGMLFVTAVDPALQNEDPVSAQLGPERYRLRGGGASSNRGFLPGDLGDPADGVENYDPLDGGLRRWEASLELRTIITQNFGITLFADFGDVNQEAAWRFHYLHTTLGLGIRYQTPVGPFRFDFGFRIPRWQVAGSDDDPPAREGGTIGPRARIPGSIHLTIGEAF